MISKSKILFSILISVIPLGQILRLKVATNIFITPQDIVVFIIFLISSMDLLKNRKLKLKLNFVTFQILFLSIGIISLFYNALRFNDINLLPSVLYPLRYFMYLSLLNVVNLIPKELNVRKSLVAVGVVMVVLGFFQYLFYIDLKYLYYLGWDNHLYRLFSTFLDPNFTGVYYAILSLFIFSSVIEKNLAKSYRELVFSFFSVTAMFLTYSRTALIAFLAGIATVSIIKKKLKILVVSMLVFGVILVSISDISIEGLNPFRTASSKERLKSMKEAVSIYADNPLIGVGFNAYRHSMVRHGFRTTTGVAMSNADAGTDNSFLFVLATTGIFGFIFFVLSYIFLLKELYVERLRIGIIPICMITSFLVSSLFLNVLFYTPILIFVFIVISLRKRAFEILD